MRFEPRALVVTAVLALGLVACGTSDDTLPRIAVSITDPPTTASTSTASSCPIGYELVDGECHDPDPATTKAKPKIKKLKAPVKKIVKPKPKPKRTTVRTVYYANCTAVRAAGADPIYAGDPGYSRKLDRDGDGVACE